jgi:hypothetical protein
MSFSNSFNFLASPKSESTPRADPDFPALGAKPQAKPARQPRPAAAAAGGAEADADWETVQGKAPKPAKKQSKPKPKQQQPSAFGADAQRRRQREAIISGQCVPIILGNINDELKARCDWVNRDGTPMLLYQKLWIKAHPANDGMVPIVNKRTGEHSMVPVWSQHRMDIQSADGVAEQIEHDGMQFSVHEIMSSPDFGARLLAMLRGDDLFTTDTFIQPMVSEKCLFIKFSRHMGPRPAPAPAAPSRPPAPAAAPLAEAPVSVPAPRPAPRAPWAKDAKGGS